MIGFLGYVGYDGIINVQVQAQDSGLVKSWHLLSHVSDHQIDKR